MISFCMISCMYDIIETKKLHNIHYPFINYRWSHPRSSNYRRPRPWTRTSGTIGDLAHGLQLGLEPTTQALEIQRFNHYAMERSNKQSNSLCIYYQPSWLARREKNWNIWLVHCISPFVSTTMKQFNKNANGSILFKILVDAKYMCKLIPS